MYLKRLLFFYILINVSFNELSSQTFTFKVKDDCSAEGSLNFLEPNELHADFIEVNVFGEAPLQVKFIDTSTGNPTKWHWDFGDGSSDTLPNTIHIYPDPGVYTVRLTVHAGEDSASIKKTDLVRVAVSGGCDSLNYPMPGEYQLYEIFFNGSGYISGNNSYGNLAVASYFDEFEDGGELLAGFFDFGFAERLPTNDVSVFFKAWDDSGPEGSPGNVLDSVAIPISSIVQDYELGRSTLIVFEEPILLDGSFFLGLDLPQVHGDTLALYTNIDGDVEVGNGWEQSAEGNWKPYAETQWSLDIDNAIFPVVCQPVGIENPYLERSLSLFPIPAKDEINFVFADVSIEVRSVQMIDITGRQVLIAPLGGNNFGLFNISILNEGFYFVRFETSAGEVNRKVVVGR